MLDFGTHARLTAVGLTRPFAQGRVPIGTLVGEILGVRRELFQSFALFLAPVGAIAIEAGLLAVQEIRHFMAKAPQ